MKKLILSLIVLLFMGALSLKAQVRVTVRPPYKRAVVVSPVLVSPALRRVGIHPAAMVVVSRPVRPVMVAPGVVVVRPVAVVRPLPVVRRRVIIYH